MVSIIATVGYPAAGKSVVSEIAEKMGFPVVYMGDILKQKYRNKFHPSDIDGDVSEMEESEKIGKWATSQREEKGYDIVAKWTKEYIENEISENVVVLDGLRSLDEHTVLDDAFDEVNILYIKCDEQIRLKRIQDRDRDGEGSYTIRDLRERDKREEKWGLDEVVTQSDDQITNEKDLEQFKSNVKSYLTQFSE